MAQKTLNIYLQKRKARQLAGKLFREGKKFVFEYEGSYRLSPNPLSLGPDLPLSRARHSSLKLFASFKDRLPSRQNPAYESYCRANGISPQEKDPLVLLAGLGQKGPGSFVLAPAPPSNDFSSQDLKRFRKSLRLSIREFALLFDISSAGIYRVENGRSSGAGILKKIKAYKDRPEMALYQIKHSGAGLSDSKRRFAERQLQSKINTIQGPWAVRAKDIQECNSYQATELLRRLLLQEAINNGIPQSAVHVSENITAPDGGQDGLIAWAGEPEGTNYLPKRHNCFQMKAKAVKPSECKKELFNKKEELKGAITNLIKKKGAYILCSTHLCSGAHLSLREEKLQEALEEAVDKKPALKSKLPSIEIKFYDANKLANWLNSHPPTALWFLKEIGKAIPPSWRLWSEWAEEFLEEPKYQLNSKLREKKQQIYNGLLRPKTAIHLTGASGLGKTRLAFEAFRPDLEKEDHLDLSHLALYSSAEELTLKDIRDLKGSRAILIVDNCNARQAEAFRKIALSADSQLSLLTIAWPEQSFTGGAKLLNEKASMGFLDSGKAFPQDSAHTTSSALSKASFYQIQLKPDEEIVKQMLANRSNIKILYFNPLALKLTQGWPLMAKLLIKGGPDELLKENAAFSPSEWIKKMLFGKEQEDPVALKAIKACALFDAISIEESSTTKTSHKEESESEYIAQVISKLDYDEFYSKIQLFKKRQIIQQTGRFVQVRPKPLALWLTAQFISESPPKSILKWLEGMGQLPSDKTSADKISARKKAYLTKQEAGNPNLNSLKEAFCRQISSFADLTNFYQTEGYPENDLNPYSKLKTIAEKLIALGGLFGNQKALNTEWGSSCFYYLARLCPQTALRTLENIFGDKNIEELKNPLANFPKAHTLEDYAINTALQKLIQTLQGLSARKDFYDQSARLLLKFASAEKEEFTTLHYATDVFTNHFQISDSGTEAEPDKKFRIIEEIIKAPKSAYQKKSIALKALGEALKMESFNDQTFDIESFLGKSFLTEWKPKIYGELWNYHRTALSLLTELALKGNKNQDKREGELKNKTKPFKDSITNKACCILDENLRSLLRMALSQPKSALLDDLETSFKKLIAIHEPFRASVYKALNESLRYESKKYSEKDIKRIKELLIQFQPKSLENEIKLYVSGYSANEDYKEKIKSLANEFKNLISKALSEKSSQKKQPTDHKEKALCALKALFQGAQNSAFVFAVEFVQKIYQDRSSSKKPTAQIESFINFMLKHIKKWKNEDFNLEFLRGFCSKLYEQDPKSGASILDQIAQDPVLQSLLPLLCQHIDLQDRDIKRLTQLVKNKTFDVEKNLSHTGRLIWARNCQKVQPKVMLEFMKALLAKGQKSLWPALKILHRYCDPSNQNKTKKTPAPKEPSINWDNPMELLYHLLTKLLSQNSDQQINQGRELHEYTRAVTIILKSPEWGAKFADWFFSKRINTVYVALGRRETQTCHNKILKKYPNVNTVK